MVTAKVRVRVKNRVSRFSRSMSALPPRSDSDHRIIFKPLYVDDSLIRLSLATADDKIHRHWQVATSIRDAAILEKWVPYSQRYLVLGIVGLALCLVSGIALNRPKYRCE